MVSLQLAQAFLVLLMPGAAPASQPIQDADPVLIHSSADQRLQVWFLPEQTTSQVFDANCYALVDTDAKAAAVVDPGKATGPAIQRFLAAKGANVEYVLLTHGHNDHTGGIGCFAHGTQARFVISRVETALLPPSISPRAGVSKEAEAAPRFQFAPDETFLSLDKTQIQVLLTPGHTIGSQCYYVPSLEIIFTGDTLFRGNIGRTDLSFSAGRACLVAYASAKILSLPDSTWILPGHGGTSTVQAENATNPYVAATQPAGRTWQPSPGMSKERR